MLDFAWRLLQAIVCGLFFFLGLPFCSEQEPPAVVPSDVPSLEPSQIMPSAGPSLAPSDGPSPAPKTGGVIPSSSGGTVAVAGLAAITFAEGVFTEDTYVQIEKVDDLPEESVRKLEEDTALFAPSDFLPYTIRITLSNAPETDEISVNITASIDVIALVPAGSALELFVTISQESLDEEPTDMYGLIDECILTYTMDNVGDLSAYQKICRLPASAFGWNQNLSSFTTMMALSPTPGLRPPPTREATFDVAAASARDYSAATCSLKPILCPVQGGCLITSDYNPARIIIEDGKREFKPHFGVDYRARPPGRPLLAVEDGYIEFAGIKTQMGGTIILTVNKGGEEMGLRYGHMCGIFVKSGDSVFAGQIIGLSGGERGKACSGTGSKDPHLHLEYARGKDLTESKDFTGNKDRINFESTGVDAQSCVVGPIESRLDPMVDLSSISEFGHDVDLFGNTAIVAAPFSGSFSGRVYLFNRENGTQWLEQDPLTSGGAQVDDRFGRSVAISGNTVVVGAPTDATVKPLGGRVYVFSKDVNSIWNPQQMLQPDTWTSSIVRFGWAVTIDGNTIVVGYLGGAYVFLQDDTTVVWTQQQHLTLEDGAVNDFGRTVSVSGDLAVIGAPRQDDNRGCAYAFVRLDNTWTMEQKLTPDIEPGENDDPRERDKFGTHVALSRDTVIISSPGDTDEGDPCCLGRGSAYIFRRVGTHWEQEEKLRPSDSDYAGGFGLSVGIHGDMAIVGALRQEPPAGDKDDRSGRAIVFVRQEGKWKQRPTIISPPDTWKYSGYGTGVAVFGNTVVLTSKYYVDDEGNAGRAWVFELTMKETFNS